MRSRTDTEHGATTRPLPSPRPGGPRSSIATALRMSAGIAIWALHFLAIYGGTALACARGLPHWPAPSVAVATAVAVALLVVVLASGWRRRAEFASWFSAAAAAFALVAVLWEASVVLFVAAPCR